MCSTTTFWVGIGKISIFMPGMAIYPYGRTDRVSDKWLKDTLTSESIDRMTARDYCFQLRFTSKTDWTIERHLCASNLGRPLCKASDSSYITGNVGL